MAWTWGTGSTCIRALEKLQGGKMNNKEQAWRLEDENGNRIGQEQADITMWVDGKKIGTMQSITQSVKFSNGSSISSYYELGLPRNRATRGMNHDRFMQEYLGTWINENEEENDT